MKGLENHLAAVAAARDQERRQNAEQARALGELEVERAKMQKEVTKFEEQVKRFENDLAAARDEVYSHCSGTRGLR